VKACAAIEVRLRRPAPVAVTLAHSLAAFETIRLLVRAYEDKVPSLFAAFMTAADAAVDGREALMAAPSLSTLPEAAPAAEPAGDGRVDEVIDAVASVSAVLSAALARVAALALAPGDRTACGHAARAAGRIHQAMSRDGDDGLTG
jgi:hypothetical protein